MSEKVIKVNGMTCGHCVETVTKAARDLGGVRDVGVNLETKEVTLNFDESLTPLEKIKAAINDAGFEVETD